MYLPRYSDRVPCRACGEMLERANATCRSLKCSAARYNSPNSTTLAASRLRRYGLSAEDYALIWRQQRERCALCGKTDNGARPWHVDHDHEFGWVRGILCHGCNIHLSRNESEAARRYLATPPAFLAGVSARGTAR